MSDDYEVLIVGCGVGGGTLAHRLAGSGHRILILEAGEGPSHVGGEPARHTASCFRLREQDFGRLRHRGGTSPAWPLRYDEMEPYYTQAELLYRVHGTRGEDPSEPTAGTPYAFPAAPHNEPTQVLSDALGASGLHPFHSPRACLCDTSPCGRHTCTDTESAAVLPALAHGNVALMRHARVDRLETDSSGRRVTAVLAVVEGTRHRFTASLVVVSAGATGSAVLLLASTSGSHPNGLANGSNQVGRNYLVQNRLTVPSVPEDGAQRLPYSIGINDYYFGDDDFEYPMGSVQLIVDPASAVEPAARPAFELTTEGLPSPDNRLLLSATGRAVLRYVPNNRAPLLQLQRRVLHHLRHVGAGGGSGPVDLRQRGTEVLTPRCRDGAGTTRFGHDPGRSVLDVSCKAHEVDNLYVVDSGFMPSTGAVDISLTVMANALRVGDHLLSRLG